MPLPPQQTPPHGQMAELRLALGAIGVDRPEQQRALLRELDIEPVTVAGIAFIDEAELKRRLAAKNPKPAEPAVPALTTEALLSALEARFAAVNADVARVQATIDAALAAADQQLAMKRRPAGKAAKR